jgi:hypothetical protein
LGGLLFLTLYLSKNFINSNPKVRLLLFSLFLPKRGAKLQLVFDKTKFNFKKNNSVYVNVCLFLALRNSQNGVAKIVMFFLSKQIKFKDFFICSNRWTSLSERDAKVLSFFTFSNTFSKITARLSPNPSQSIIYPLKIIIAKAKNHRHN